MIIVEGLMVRVCSACERKQRPRASAKTSEAEARDDPVLTDEFDAYRIKSTTWKAVKMARDSWVFVSFGLRRKARRFKPVCFCGDSSSKLFLISCLVTGDGMVRLEVKEQMELSREMRFQIGG